MATKRNASAAIAELETALPPPAEDGVQWPADRVERRAVASLIPYARNARTHSEAQVGQIAASIREWGWTTPVLCDEGGGLIAGHGRVLAAKLLGLESVPVMIARGWTKAQKAAYVLADNKLALNAGWDPELLRLELADLAELGVDLNLTGFDAAELAGFFDTPQDKDPPDDFAGYDENIETEHQCPSCGYKWSGGARLKGGGPEG